MSQLFNPNGYSPIQGMGQQQDPVMERERLLQSIKASIMGRPVQPTNQRREAIMQQVGQPPLRAGATPAEGVVHGIGSIVDGFATRHYNKGPFPDAPGGGKISPFQGLANMFGFGGGLY